MLSRLAASRFEAPSACTASSNRSALAVTGPPINSPTSTPNISDRLMMPPSEPAAVRGRPCTWPAGACPPAPAPSPGTAAPAAPPGTAPSGPATPGTARARPAAARRPKPPRISAWRRALPSSAPAAVIRANSRNMPCRSSMRFISSHSTCSSMFAGTGPYPPSWPIPRSQPRRPSSPSCHHQNPRPPKPSTSTAMTADISSFSFFLSMPPTLLPPSRLPA